MYPIPTLPLKSGEGLLLRLSLVFVMGNVFQIFHRTHRAHTPPLISGEGQGVG